MSLIDLNAMDFDTITPEGLAAEVKEAIATALAAQNLEIDMREGSYTDALIRECIYQVYKAIMLAQDLMYVAVPGPDGGSYLDAFAATYGLTRSSGSKATVLVTFTGTDSTAIPAGTWVVADTGERFQTMTDATIQSGSASVLAEAEDMGAKYNINAEEINRLQSSLPGIESVSNGAATGGADSETDRAFYDRLHTLLSEPVASGNVNNYKQWARECNGVGHVAVIPLWDGNGTVKVIVAGEDKLPVDEAICKVVADHIEAERPIGASVTVTSVVALEVTVEATVTIDSTTTAETVQADMEAAMQQLFDSLEVGAGETIRYNRVLALILSLPGIIDCSTLKINDATSNIVLGSEQVPQLGAVTITAAAGVNS